MATCAVCNKKRGLFARSWNACKECGREYCRECYGALKEVPSAQAQRNWLPGARVCAGCSFPIFKVLQTRSPFGPG